MEFSGRDVERHVSQGPHLLRSPRVDLADAPVKGGAFRDDVVVVNVNVFGGLGANFLIELRGSKMPTGGN